MLEKIEKETKEMQEEIRLRSPGGPSGAFAGTASAGPVLGGGTGGSGSNRASMCNIVGHITQQMPTYLSRQLSYASLNPVSDLEDN